MPDLSVLYNALDDAERDIRDSESKGNPRPWLEGAVCGIRNVLIEAGSEYLERQERVPPPQPPLDFAQVRDKIIDEFEPTDLGCDVATALGNTSKEMHIQKVEDLTIPGLNTIRNWLRMALSFLEEVESTPDLRTR